MRILLIISKLIVGITFILSGFLKAIDPVGFGLKIDEYLKAFHLEFLDFAALAIGICFILAEFTIGFCIIAAVKIRLMAKAALWFIILFTLITLYSAIFDPVQDCGCFGEAVHLTNWETFFKNIVLLCCILALYLKRGLFTTQASRQRENMCVAGSVAFIMAVCCYSLMFLPPTDFGAFKPGTDLVGAAMDQPEMEYETTFIYSKDGKKREFMLNNLPDSTWTFVEANTKLISASSQVGEVVDFILKNSNGEYVTEQVLESPAPLFLITIYNSSGLSDGNVEMIIALRNSAIANGARFHILSGNTPEATLVRFNSTATDVENASIQERENTVTQEDILYTDYKTALLLNRSNGGAVYVDKGIIVRKWSRLSYPVKDLRSILEEDSEIVTADSVIRGQIFIKVAFILLALMVIVAYYFSKKM